jgi:hypothetical protein
MYYKDIDPDSFDYQDFGNSPYWRAVLDLYWSDDTLPKYCWICFSFKNIQLHHEDYNALGHELERGNLRKFILSCKIVPVCLDCHHMLTFDDLGNKFALRPSVLRERRIQLRRDYIRKNLRPTTMLYFTKQFIYRLLW